MGGGYVNESCSITHVTLTTIKDNTMSSITIAIGNIITTTVTITTNIEFKVTLLMGTTIGS